MDIPMLSSWPEEKRKKLLLYTIVALGVFTCFMGEGFVPTTHFTLGKLCRYAAAAAIIIIVLSNYKMILSRLQYIEKCLIMLAFSIGVLAIFNAYLMDVEPDFFYFGKIILLNVFIYAMAKMLDENQMHLFFKCIFCLGCIASIQAIITVMADLFEIYYIGEVIAPVLNDEGNIVFPFWGLTGAHNFMRASWYYSESSYFTQFLLLGLGYAITTRRYVGILLITLGILSAFAVATMAACGITLLALLIFSRGKLLKPILTVLLTILACYLTIGDFYKMRAKEGITVNVFSKGVILDLKRKQSDMEALQARVNQLTTQLEIVSTGKKQEIHKQIKALQVNINTLNESLKSNLNGRDLDSFIKDMEKVQRSSWLNPSNDVFYRGGSKIDKINSLRTAWVFFLNYPFGGGMKAPHDFNIKDLNTSPGWVGLVLTFGCLAFVILIPLYWFIAKTVLFTTYNPAITPLVIVLGGLLLATFWHGPHLQYHMIFILSMLYSAITNKEAQRV